MSQPLVPCPHCGAHVFAGDVACPSCDGAIARAPSIVPTLVGAGLLATTIVGSLMISACAYGCPDCGHFDAGRDSGNDTGVDSATAQDASGTDTGP